MNNFISLNINYLCEQNNLQFNEFAEIVDAGRSVVSMWASGSSKPKLEAIQKICAHFSITLDDFINRDLREVERIQKPGYIDAHMEAAALRDPCTFYDSGLNDELRRQIENKNEIIKTKDELLQVLRDRIKELEEQLGKDKRQAG